MRSRWVWILVGIALVLRLLLLTFHETVEIDGVYYITMGKNFIQGNGLRDIEGNINTVFMPLYPIFTGVVSLIVSNGELAARLISIIFGALLILPVYGLARRIYDQKVALIAAAITAVYPALTYISSITYADSLYLFLITSAMYTGYRALQSGVLKEYIATAVLYSLAYLTRPEGWLYILLTALYVLWHKREQWKKAIKPAATVLIVACLVVLPYLAFVYTQSGDLSLSSKGYVIYKFRAYQPFSEEYEKNIFGLNEAKDDILLNPYKVRGSFVKEVIAQSDVFLLRYITNLVREIYIVIPKVFPFIIFSLFAFALRSWNKDEWKKESYLLMLVAYPILFYPLFWVEARYLLPILPIVILWAGKGIVQIAERWKSIKISWMITGIILVSLLGNIFANHLIDSRFEKINPPVEHKQAGLWVKEQYMHPRIMERKPWVSFYGGGTFVNFPYVNSYDELIIYACNNKVDLMVIDERYTAPLRPQVAALLGYPNPTLYPEVHKVYEEQAYPPKKSIMIYQINCDKNL